MVEGNRVLFRMGRSTRQMAIVLAMSVVMGTTVSCGGGAKMAAVTGTVRLDGKPVPDVFVVFTPQAEEDSIYAATKDSSGRTDANGYYTLSTKKPGDGAAVATHKVSILALESNTRPPGQLPPGFQVEVTPGSNVIDLELVAAGGRRPSR